MATYDFAALSVKLTANLQEFSAGLASSTKQMKDWATTNEGAIKGVGLAFTAMGTVMVGALAYGVKAAMDFEKAITDTATMTGKTGEAFIEVRKQLADYADGLERVTSFTDDQAAVAMKNLLVRGIDPLKVGMDGMKTMFDLATGAGLDLNNSVNMVANGLKAFGLQASDAGRVADIFAKASTSSGMAIQEFEAGLTTFAPVAKTAGMELEGAAAVLAKVGQMGVPATTAAMGLKMAFNELLSPSQKTVEILGNLGLTTADVSLQTKTFAEVMTTLAGRGITTAQVLDLFGNRAGIVVNKLFEIDSSGRAAYSTIGELETTLQNAGGTAEQMAKQQMATLAGQLNILKISIENVAQNIGTILLPRLTELVTSWRSNIEALNIWMQANPGVVAAITTMATGLAALSLGIGAVSMIFNPLVNVVNAMAMGFMALSKQIAIATAASVAAKTAQLEFAFAANGAATAVGASSAAASAFGIVLTGAFAAAVLVAITQIASLVKEYWELYKVQLQIKEGVESSSRSMMTWLNNHSAAASEMLAKYHDLSQEEQIRLASIPGHVAAIQTQVAAMKEQGATIDEINIYLKEQTIALGERDGQMMLGIETSKRMTEEEYALAQAKQTTVSAEKEQITIWTEAKMKLQELVAAYNTGKISIEEYATGYNAVRDSLVGVAGDTDLVSKKLFDLSNTDVSVKVNFEMRGEADVMAAADKVRSLNQQIVLEQLTGKDKLIAQEKFRAEDEINNIRRTIEERKRQLDAFIMMSNAQRDIDVANARASVIVNNDAEQQKLDAKVAAITKAYDTQVAAQKQIVERELELIKIQEAATEKLSQTRLELIAREGQALAANKDMLIKQYEEMNTYVSGISGGSAPTGGGAKMVTQTMTAGGLSPMTSLSDSLKQTSQVVANAATNVAAAQQNLYPVLASGQGYGTTWGAGSSSGSALRSYEVGAAFIPRTGIYKLHKGESVKTANDGKAGSGLVIINLIDEKQIPSIIAKYPNAIINPVFDFLNSPLGRKTVKQAGG